tara:strand:- start:110 stop:277 length:168 start_codon:yes stop_codon:yes gene_type:complete
MKDTEEVTKEFKDFILECCDTDFPLRGKALEAVIDRYFKLLISAAQVDELKKMIL